ncbi:MAG: hypothetical protein ACK4IT_05580 [Thioalkalivibrionaceae bacterium]
MSLTLDWMWILAGIALNPVMADSQASGLESWDVSAVELDEGHTAIEHPIEVNRGPEPDRSTAAAALEYPTQHVLPRGADMMADAGAMPGNDRDTSRSGRLPSDLAMAPWPVDPIMARSLPLEDARWTVVEEGGCRIEQTLPVFGTLRFIAPPAQFTQAGFVAARPMSSATPIVVRIVAPSPVTSVPSAFGASSSTVSVEPGSREVQTEPLARWSATRNLADSSSASRTGSSPSVGRVTAQIAGDSAIAASNLAPDPDPWPERPDRELRHIEFSRGAGLVAWPASIGDQLFEALLAGDDVWVGIARSGLAPRRDEDLDWAIFRGLRFAVAVSGWAECREAQIERLSGDAALQTPARARVQLRFATAQTALDAGAERVLDDWLQNFGLLQAPNPRLRVLGYADPRGATTRNEALARARAEAAAAFLRRRLPRAEIQSEGRGELTGVALEDARRVEILWLD